MLLRPFLLCIYKVKVIVVSMGYKTLDSWLRNIKVSFLVMYCILPLFTTVSLVYTEAGISNDGSYQRQAYSENVIWIYCQLPNCLKNICVPQFDFNLLIRSTGITERTKEKKKVCNSYLPFIKDSIFSLYPDSHWSNITIYTFRDFSNTSPQNFLLCLIVMYFKNNKFPLLHRGLYNAN